nr:putative nucleotidyltransferase, ribonuclease H [Tanacetum cinerariifolium]
MFRWILYLGFLALNGESILCLLLLTGFPRWCISFHVEDFRCCTYCEVVLSRGGLFTWSSKVPYFESGYAVHSSTGFSPFEVVYKTSPRQVVDLVDLPGKKSIQANRMVEEVQATHEVVRANITEANAKYKFAADKHRRKKLFQVGDETFNVSDIYEFHSEDVNKGKHLRTSSSIERGNDEEMINELVEEYMEHLERGKISKNY